MVPYFKANAAIQNRFSKCHFWSTPDVGQDVHVASGFTRVSTDCHWHEQQGYAFHMCDTTVTDSFSLQSTLCLFFSQAYCRAHFFDSYGFELRRLSEGIGIKLAAVHIAYFQYFCTAYFWQVLFWKQDGLNFPLSLPLCAYVCIIYYMSIVK